MIPYQTFSEYCRIKFGGKVYKLALKGGETCPNRDGTKGFGGCLFCANGSGDFAEDEGSVAEQIARAKLRLKDKTNADKFIAYFQSYTATYGDLTENRKRFSEAAETDGIVAVSIATRPDCLGRETLSVLQELREKKPLFVELGLQTIHDRVAEAFNRGYRTEEYFRAVDDLHAIGANVVTHVILGLPQESRSETLQTVQAVANVTDGIKLQLLHVLSGTPLAKLYERGEYQPLSEEEYLSLVVDCLRLLPSGVAVHRMTGDAPRRLLLAPLWSADKKSVLNALSAAIARAE